MKLRLADFCVKSPPPGRGKTRVQYSFASIIESITEGRRIENIEQGKPLCYADYIKFWTEQCDSCWRHFAPDRNLLQLQAIVEYENIPFYMYQTRYCIVLYLRIVGSCCEGQVEDGA